MKFPPKKINSLYGYRTSSSMKSQERWDFAQIYSAKEMFKAGAILCMAGTAALFVNINEGWGVALSLALMLLLVIQMFYKTEQTMKQKFPDK